jgi:hypothetical protein
MITKLDALTALGFTGTLRQNQLFIDSDNPPTEEAIQAKLAELQADYEANQYQRDRAADYPSWQEQMDLLYHGGVDALKAELKKTKDKFPKPE